MQDYISPGSSWRDSARPSKFFIFNSSAMFPLVLFLLHIRWWTLAIAVAAMLFLTIIQRYGFTIPVFGRWIRSIIAGPTKVATPWWL